jgi:ABC-type transport system involved in multi-copper enzyme maturation permease subunit
MPAISIVCATTLRSIIRDRVLHALLVGTALIFFLVPVFSSFSMRQAQELSITLALSGLSFVLLVFALLYGASSIWRDIEKRQTAALLGLPLSRSNYLLGKFFGIALFLCGTTILLAMVCCVVISLGAAQYQADVPVSWMTVMLAIAGSGLKYVLLMAIALLLSSISTSLFLPIFGALGVYFAGSASQEVMEYISGEFGRQMAPLAKMTILAVYYVIPNFSAFDFTVEAAYALPISGMRILIMVVYFVVYVGIVLSLAAWCFSKRELP